MGYWTPDPFILLLKIIVKNSINNPVNCLCWLSSNFFYLPFLLQPTKALRGCLAKTWLWKTGWNKVETGQQDALPTFPGLNGSLECRWVPRMIWPALTVGWHVPDGYLIKAGTTVLCSPLLEAGGVRSYFLSFSGPLFLSSHVNDSGCLKRNKKSWSGLFFSIDDPDGWDAKRTSQLPPGFISHVDIEGQQDSSHSGREKCQRLWKFRIVSEIVEEGRYNRSHVGQRRCPQHEWLQIFPPDRQRQYAFFSAPLL